MNTLTRVFVTKINYIRNDSIAPSTFPLYSFFKIFYYGILKQIYWLTDIWEIPRSEIVLGKELGTGQFGVSEP